MSAPRRSPRTRSSSASHPERVRNPKTGRLISASDAVFDHRGNCVCSAADVGECSICSEDHCTEPRAIRCGHSFCGACIDGWFAACAAQSNPATCPLCRTTADPPLPPPEPPVALDDDDGEPSMIGNEDFVFVLSSWLHTREDPFGIILFVLDEWIHAPIREIWGVSFLRADGSRGQLTRSDVIMRRCIRDGTLYSGHHSLTAAARFPHELSALTYMAMIRRYPELVDAANEGNASIPMKIFINNVLLPSIR